MLKGHFIRSMLLGSTMLFSSNLYAQTTTGTKGAPDVPVAAAGQDDENGLQAQDIVVTAQRRSERLQDVPLAITAVSGTELGSQNITNVLQLTTLVPNVQFGQAQGQARLAIRGVGFDTTNPGNEARVAYNLDGFYISRPGAVLGTFYDIDCVEVLRGPQGTLYGRNALAGNINVLTRGPTDTFQGFAEVAIGNYNLVKVEAGVGGPIAEGVSFRLAGQTQDRDGFGYNPTTGQGVDGLHTRAIRGKLRLEPSSSITMRIDADYFKQDDTGGAYHFQRDCGGCTDSLGRPYIITTLAFGSSFPTNPRDYNGNTQPRTIREIYGFGLTTDIALSDSVTLTSLTGYRNTTSINIQDQDATPLRFGPSTLADNSEQFSEELRVNFSFDGGSLVVGGYYFNEDIDGSQLVPSDLRFVLYNAGRGNPLATSMPEQLKQGYAAGGQMNTKSLAGFAHLNYDLTSQLSVELGARYSWEKKQKYNEYYQFDLGRTYSASNPVIPSPSASCPQAVAAGLVASGGQCFIPYDTRTDRAFTPSATIKFNPVEGLMLYATYSKGFKTGGFNLAGVQPSFAPEKLTDYEGGIKATFLDGRLRTNLSIFHYDRQNVQVNQIGLLGIVVTNAAAAHVDGAEAEITALPFGGGFQIDANIGYLRGRYGDFVTLDPFNGQSLNLKGYKLPNSPPFSFDLGVQNTWNVGDHDLTLRGEMHHVAKYYFNQFNVDTVSQPTFDTFNAFLTYGGASGLYGSIFVQNITNKLYSVAASRHSTLYGGFTNAIFGDPRTFGAKVGYRF